mmetsp:Transcript_89014/g.153959  ORF Transcript_89014/g.153959 Transcript_89014/m.153959 type:complete len:276 (+) Transcript_89014:120-947(+)
MGARACTCLPLADAQKESPRDEPEQPAAAAGVEPEAEPAGSGQVTVTEDAARPGMLSLSGMSKAPKLRTPEQLPSSSQSEMASASETKPVEEDAPAEEKKLSLVSLREKACTALTESSANGRLVEVLESVRGPVAAPVAEAAKRAAHAVGGALTSAEHAVEGAFHKVADFFHHHDKEEPKAPDELKASDELKAPDGSIWMVIGGEDKGGIVTRRGESLTSPAMPRLSTGARVKQLDLKGERLHYQKVEGDGPEFGWVSLRIKGKRLLMLADEQDI